PRWIAYPQGALRREPRATVGHMRLLVVEDGAAFAELVRSGLAGAGFTVVTVSTAADAVAALEITNYDAAILDLGLPDGDGLDVLAQARRGGHAIPVLLLTARDTVDDRVLGLNAGADDYLIKP